MSAKILEINFICNFKQKKYVFLKKKALNENNKSDFFIYLPPEKRCLTFKQTRIMRIGIPKEIKNNENRVGMTPAGVAELIRHGHEVMVQHTAGENSGFSDAEYEKVGARILPDIESVYREAEMIVKVKEPIKQEYKLIRKDQLVFTYFHFACEKELTEL